MINPIKTIVEFNKKAGLLDKPYDDFLESSFQIEEALEGFDLIELTKLLCPDSELEINFTPKFMSRVIAKHAGANKANLSDVDRLDKACDAVVFAVGSMAKLGLNAQEITAALNIVMKYNMKKLSAPKDEFGKQMKPEGWTGPEPELQALLDSIKK